MVEFDSLFVAVPRLVVKAYFQRMFRELVVVVVEVPHGRWFLCHLEEIDFGCVVVVVVVQSSVLAL